MVSKRVSNKPLGLDNLIGKSSTVNIWLGVTNLIALETAWKRKIDVKHDYLNDYFVYQAQNNRNNSLGCIEIATH